jgi:cyclopropane fatty-acyl-phospholipid synthase-like methyltransferase
MTNFDNSYSSIKSGFYSPNSSLLSFLEFAEDRFLNETHRSVLEIGCGNGLLKNHSDVRFNYSGVELSKTAYELLSNEDRSRVINEDFLTHDFDRTFDLLIDSHMAHCLSSIELLKSYFLKCRDLLNSGGVLLIELMVTHSSFRPDDGYIYDENEFTLKKGDVVHRLVLHSRFIEEIVQQADLKIVYLRVDETLKFIPYSHRSDALVTDPQRLRLICLKE